MAGCHSNPTERRVVGGGGGGAAGREDKGSDSGLVLNVGPKEFPDWLEVSCKRKGRVKDGSNVFE